MHANQLLTHEDGVIEAAVTIQRPVEEVFAYYREFRNLPRFLGDVMAVETVDAVTSLWTVQGPLHLRARWTARVTEERKNELIRYEVTRVRSCWTVRFSPGHHPGSTVVHEVLRTPFGKLGRVALALLAKDPAQEVLADLHRLKQVMETGRVTDTSHAVADKFGRGG